MTLLLKCQRCWREYDFDANRSLNPHGHGVEPDRDTVQGTRVRLLRDIYTYGLKVAVKGEVATVKGWIAGPHATANGGGYDVSVVFDDGRRFPSAFYDGSWQTAAKADVADHLTIRSTSLEIA